VIPLHTLEIKRLKATGRVDAILLDGKPLLVSELMICAGAGKPTEIYLKILVDETTLLTEVEGAHLTIQQLQTRSRP